MLMHWGFFFYLIRIIVPLLNRRAVTHRDVLVVIRTPVLFADARHPGHLNPLLPLPVTGTSNRKGYCNRLKEQPTGSGSGSYLVFSNGWLQRVSQQQTRLLLQLTPLVARSPKRLPHVNPRTLCISWGHQIPMTHDFRTGPDDTQCVE